MVDCYLFLLYVYRESLEKMSVKVNCHFYAGLEDTKLFEMRGDFCYNHRRIWGVHVEFI